MGSVRRETYSRQLCVSIQSDLLLLLFADRPTGWPLDPTATLRLIDSFALTLSAERRIPLCRARSASSSRKWARSERQSRGRSMRPLALES